MSFETDNPFRDIPERVSIFMLLDSLGIQHKGKDCKIRSPLRDERTPSFSIFRNGLKWKDQASGLHGDVIDLWMAYHGTEDKKAAIDALARLAGITVKGREKGELPSAPGRYRRQRRPEPLFQEVPAGVRSLAASEITTGRRSDPSVPWQLLVNKKGISPDAVKAFAYEGSIGMPYGRDLLPAIGASAEVIERGLKPSSLLYLMGRGVKCRPEANTSHRDHWLAGKGGECLFRGEALFDHQITTDTRPPIFITEGETDCMVLQEEFWERGSPAFVTGAHGASWTPDFRLARRYFKGSDIYIVGDNDKAGDEFGDRLVKHLLDLSGCRSARRLVWHRDLEEVNDIGEAREKKLMDDFISLLRCKRSWV
jgi:hypothetical protein